MFNPTTLVWKWKWHASVSVIFSGKTVVVFHRIVAFLDLFELTRDAHMWTFKQQFLVAWSWWCFLRNENYILRNYVLFVYKLNNMYLMKQVSLLRCIYYPVLRCWYSINVVYDLWILMRKITYYMHELCSISL